VLADDEVCDDGNNVDGDGCNATCLSAEVCGNLVVDSTVGESCEDGNLVSHDGCSSSCVDEEPEWTRVITGFSPPGRGNYGISYDSLRDEVVVFGGGGTTALNDTWVWRDRRWRHVAVGELAPPARASFGMVYDPVRSETVLFGGLDTVSLFGGTWIWDGRGWHEEFVDVAPLPRVGPAMTYDIVRERALLYGGVGGTGLSDLWEWDGDSWTEVAPDDPDAPSPGNRVFSAMHYDPVRNETILFGGNNGAVNDDATWAWNGAEWQQRFPATSPPARRAHSMTFDTAAGTIILFGGVEESAVSCVTNLDCGAGHYCTTLGTCNFRLNDAWEWDGENWSELSSVTTPPAHREGAGMVYSQGLGSAVMFGGFSSAEPFSKNDTWLLQGGDWSHLESAASAPHFLPRIGFAAATDRHTGEVVAYGGLRLSCEEDAPCPNVCADGGCLVDEVCDSFTLFCVKRNAETWRLRDGRWIFVGDQGPGEREFHALASVRDRVLLFGGSNKDSLPSGTWEFFEDTWRKVPSIASPPGRVAHAMSEGPDETAVLFAGLGGNEPLGDTWTFRGGEWKENSPSASPTARAFHAMAFDRRRNRVVLFGGLLDVATPSRDTWEWDGATWREIITAESPAPRTYHSMAYNPERGRVVLYGGETTGGAPLFDTWEFDGEDWERLSVGGSPSHTRLSRMVYDPKSRSLVQLGAMPQDTLWRFQYRGSGIDEVCTAVVDRDGDLAFGCEDPDCWSRCTPECPPGALCSASEMSCGDGLCNDFSSLETCRLCEEDCGLCQGVCGDSVCDPDEEVSECPGDCG